jgi:hypothetical protein
MLSNRIPVPDESFLHFFVQCEAVAQLREGIFTKYFDFVDISGDTKKDFGWEYPRRVLRTKNLARLQFYVYSTVFGVQDLKKRYSLVCGRPIIFQTM